MMTRWWYPCLVITFLLIALPVWSAEPPELPAIGAAELVVLEPKKEKLVLKARIDTGAKTSSLGAVGIVKFERDGVPWVRFKVHDPKAGELVEFSRKIERTIKVKRHDTESQKRFVVKMWAKLGEIELERNFSLADRSDFEYPMLIGRNVLSGRAVVDVSKEFILGGKGGAEK